MKKGICTSLVTASLVLGMATSTFAAQTGLYVGGNYYSTDYLGTLSVAQRVAILSATQANPTTSFAVIGTKYSTFANYTGLSSLVEGADAKVPAQVTNVGTGAIINPVTGAVITPGAATVSSVSAINVTCVAGIAPVLPATGTATYSDATTKTVNITWAAVAATSYAAAGTFTVQGTIAESATVKATATVTVTAAATLAVSSVKAVNSTTSEIDLAGSTAVSPGAKFKIVFSSPVTASTVNLNTIKLYKGTALAPVTAVTISIDNTTVTVTPATMSNSSDYKLSLSGSIAAGTTNLTAVDYTFKTTNTTLVNTLTSDATGAATAITTNIVPTADMGAGNTIQLAFNNKLDAGSINSSTVKIFNTTAATEVAGVIAPAINGTNNIRFTVPATAGTWLAAGANSKYRIEVSGVVDEFGNAVQAYSKSIICTPTAPTATVAKSDGTALVDGNTVYFGKQTTTNAAGTVLNGAKATVTFNVAMDETTISGATIYVQKIVTGQDPVAVAGTVTYSAAAKIAQWTPNADLEQGANYKLTVANTIKDVNAQVISGLTRTFSTTVTATPEVATATPANGSATAVPTASQFVVNFAFGRAIYEDTLTPAAQQVPSGAANKLVKTSTIHVYNAATEAYVAPANYTVSQEADLKNIKITFNSGVLTKNTTYAVKLVGKNASGDPAKEALSDVFSNFMVNDYIYLFTTEPQDVVAPAPLKVVSAPAGTDPFLTTATEIQSGVTNFDVAKDLDVIFNKQLTTVLATAYDANGGNATQDGNVILEVYNPATATWAESAGTQLDTAGAGGAIFNDGVQNKGYMRIAAADLVANQKLRLRITPTVGAGSVKDNSPSANVMAQEYTFEFSTGNGPVIPVQATAPGTAKTVTNAASLAGATTIQVPNASLVSANTNLLAIELADGSFFFTSEVGAIAAATPTGADDTITIADQLPLAVANGATIVNMTTVNASDAKYATTVSVSDPISLRVNGAAATAKIDATTIAGAVKLYKASDNSEVPSTVTYKLVNTDQDALVSINPTADLAGSTGYYVKVSGLKDKTGNTQSAASIAAKVSFQTAAVVSPVVLSNFNITDGDINVPVKTTLSFKQTNSALTKAAIEALYVPDLQTDTVAAAAGVIRLVEMDGNGATGDQVKATSSYDAATGILTITPTVPLKASALFQLQIGTTAFGGGAAALTANKNIEFRTATAVAPALLSAKVVEAGAVGLDGNVLILTFDSEVVIPTNAPAASGADLDTFFTFTGGKMSQKNVGAGAQAVAVTNNGKTLTISYGTSVAGDYIIPGSTTIAPQAALQATDTDNGIAFGLTAVTITN